MDPFKQMRVAGAHGHATFDASDVVAKAAKARRARWERENRIARRRRAAPPHPDLGAIDTASDWPIFVLFIGTFLTLVVVAAMVVPRG
jgi:hypothetical protein